MHCGSRIAEKKPVAAVSFKFIAIDTHCAAFRKENQKELEIEPNSTRTLIMACGNCVKVDVWSALAKRAPPGLAHTIACTEPVDQNVQVY